MASLSAVPALPAIPSQIGRYKIVCELGQGGMGTIYLGRAEGIGGFERLMAIKMIHPHLSKQQSFINMFLDEARIAALIRHPNVVPVYEIGEHGGRHFIAMDYVSGEPLSILLDNTWCRGIPLDFDMVAYIVSVVCEALHAAHDLNDPTGRPLKVVHRDVCPQNIMLGYDGLTRVMDFGVAKAVDQLSQTRPGTHKGKVPYMAPEQIRCQPIDRRSDIFSLGVVLWESTIGKRLFKAENDILSASKVLKGKVPRPSRAREHYPLELEAIVLKALNPKPEQRYQTAREMGQALREYLAHRASLVSPSDLENLLKTICKSRYERRTDMERRAATEAFELGHMEDETIQLFAAGESNLPNFDIDSAIEEPKQALLSAITARKVYEFEDEELDDATVRTQLEEIGFLATAEFDLLDEDRDSPRTLIEPITTDIVDPVTRKNDASAVRELAAKSDAALARSPFDIATQLLDEKHALPRAESETPIELPPEFILGPGEHRREVTPILKLDLVGGKRGLAIIAASLVAVGLVAVGLASVLPGEQPAETSSPPPKPLAARTPPPAPKPISMTPVEDKLPANSIDKVEPAKIPVAAPEKKEEPKPPPAKKEPKKEEIAKQEEPKVETPPPVEVAPPPPAPPPVEEVQKSDPEEAPIALDAELDDSDKSKIAKRAKKRKHGREHTRPEKKKSSPKQERILVGPGDL